MVRNRKHYVVMNECGYYEAENKKDTFDYFRANECAREIIYTSCTNGNYYHNRINVIESK